ncbi:MAG TPA: hypothetical protein PLK12_11645, partial [Prolixibacteraceae bacterium]|nr:hypothetical protein [Prolixibacteraceae bacterium]
EGILEEKYGEFSDLLPDHCLLYQAASEQGKGRCSEYAFRCLVCRLFGNAALTGKDGEKKYSGCKILKDKVVDPEIFGAVVQHRAPVYSDYYYQLRSIDNDYGALLLPINRAIMKSMELVYFHTRKRHKRAG